MAGDKLPLVQGRRSSAFTGHTLWHLGKFSLFSFIWGLQRLLAAVEQAAGTGTVWWQLEPRLAEVLVGLSLIHI